MEHLWIMIWTDENRYDNDLKPGVSNEWIDYPQTPLKTQQWEYLDQIIRKLATQIARGENIMRDKLVNHKARAKV